MTEQEKMKQGYLWKDDEENMALQARAASALQELSNAAMANGTSEMSLEEINAEIEAVRKAK